MDDILKYQRLEGPLEDILTREQITSAAVERNFLVLGTEQGFVHIINFSGLLIKSARVQQSQRINKISLDLDAGFLICACCSDSGDVMVLTVGADECRETKTRFNESITCICLEQSSSSQASQGFSSSSSSSTSSTIGRVAGSAVSAGNKAAGGGSKDKSFLVGTVSGKLLFHRAGWFTQKDTMLFGGTGSPVDSIAWRENLIAWADCTHVRVMEISSQTAVCQLSAPPGVGPDDPYPCLLHWHSSRELLVGWADSFRQVDISGGSDGEQNSSNSSSSGAPYSARIAAEWTADCLISGLCSFDREHVAYLGYTPPDEDAIAADDSDLIDRGSSTSNPEVVGAAGRGSEGTKTDLSAASDTPLLPGTNQPEFCIARRRTGELLSADVLPLRGENMDGPSGYTLLTSHQCAGHQSDALKWDVNSSRVQRGGNRGYAPTCFVAAPQDLVLCRVRAVDDRIAQALRRRDIRSAVEIALTDRGSLRAYSYPELIRVYLEDLLERCSSHGHGHSYGHGHSMVTGGLQEEEPGAGVNGVPSNGGDSVSIEHATQECIRLVGTDTELWEAWVHKYIDYQQVRHLSRHIPTSSPRLASSVYEAVLGSLMDDDPALFLEMLKKWGRVTPPCFDHTALARALEASRSSTLGHGKGAVINRGGSSSGHSWSSYHMEALAQLYIVAHQYEKALECYLDLDVSDRASSSSARGRSASLFVTPARSGATPAPAQDQSVPAPHKSGAAGRDPSALLDDAAITTGETSVQENIDKAEYRLVFDLIVRQNLFRTIERKILNLVRLSRPLSATLLLTHMSKLPIRAIAQQLSADRRLLLWYLHLLFTDPTALEIYGSDQDYGDLHALQVQLYAEFTPKLTYSASGTEDGCDSAGAEALPALAGADEAPPAPVRLALSGNHGLPPSPLMKFLQSGLAPLDLALQACEKQSPPLYREMVFIYAEMGETRRALQLHLKHVGDMSAAIAFVEHEIGRSQDVRRRFGGDFRSVAAAATKLQASGGGVGGAGTDESKSQTSQTLRWSVLPAATANLDTHYADSVLWRDLVDFALERPVMLGQLLDHLGICKLDPLNVLPKVREGTCIPHLRVRLLRALRSLQFQKLVCQRSTVLLEADALDLSREQNQGQRRAMKVEGHKRCSACARPLAIPPDTTSSAAGISTSSSSGSGSGSGAPIFLSGLSRVTADCVIWGPPPTPYADTIHGKTHSTVNGVVIFSNKMAFHRACFLRLQQQQQS